jgi:pilus assembly protein Flp/PilA
MTLFTLTLNGLIMNFIKNFIAEEDGVTAIEYALIAALVSAVLVAAVTAMSGGLTAVFARITTSLT